MDFDFITGAEEQPTNTRRDGGVEGGAILGGYDYFFLEEPPSDVVCPICRLVARTPQQVSCCGKIYCLSCFTELETQSKWRLRCANCREEEPESFPDRKTAGQINSLRVACTKRDDGCTWRGALRELEKHSTLCEYSNTNCPFSAFGCRSKPLRKDLEEHENTHVLQHLKMAVKTVGELERLIQDSQQDTSEQMTQLDVSINEVKGLQQSAKKDLKKQLDKRLDNQKDSLQMKLETTKIDLVSKFRSLPLVFKLENFSELQEDDEDWHSPAFYTQPVDGYRMCLRVYTNGCSEVRGTHLSLYVYLMKSDNDSNLEWPFRGTIHVEILNQLEDANHFGEKISFNSRELKNYNSSVKSSSSMGVTGLGKSRFIQLSKLEYSRNESSVCQYLREDSLYFRVSRVEVYSTSLRPWLNHVVES